MLQGITFDKQKMKSEDMAHITNMFFQGKEGITRGCNISTDANGDLVVSEGYFSVQGRLVKNVGNTIVEVPTVQSGVLYSILVFEIDLSQENELELFNQGAFKIISNATSYPTLTKQDLENGGTIYQMEFCRFQNTNSGVSGLSDTRNIFDLSMYALGTDLQNLNTQKLNTSDIEFTTATGTNQNGSTGVINARKIHFKKHNISIVSVYLNLTNIMNAGIKGSVPTTFAPNAGRNETGVLGVPNNGSDTVRFIHVYSDGAIGVMGISANNFTYFGSVSYMRLEA